MQAWEGIVHAATDNSTPRVGEEPEGWDWSRPFYSAVPLASNFAGFLGATGIVLALIARHRTGKGQRVEVPMFDAMFTLIGHSGAYVNEKGLHPPSPIHLRGSGAFRCKDGKYVQFDTSSARHLVWFAREAGITDWGPELLDIARLKRRGGQSATPRSPTRAVPDADRRGVGGHRQSRRCGHRLVPDGLRVDSDRPRAQHQSRRPA